MQSQLSQTSGQIPRFLGPALCSLSCLFAACSSQPLPEDHGQLTGAPSNNTPASTPVYKTWAAVKPVPGTPTSYTHAVAIDGQLFVVSGRTLNVGAQTGMIVQNVFAYDPSTDEWQAHEAVPQAIEQPNVAAANGKLYVLGGKGVLDVYEYDPVARTWATLGQRPVAVGIGASAVAVHGDDIYLAGGVVPDMVNPRGARVTDFAKFNAKTHVWESLPPLVEEGGYFGAAIVGDTFYTFGGSTEQRDVARPGKTFAFNLTQKTWEEKALLIYAVSSFASASVGSNVYIIGGIAGSTGRINPETQVYDTVTDTWDVTTSAPTPRFAMSAAVIDEKIYVPGGVRQTGEASVDAVANVEVLGP